jgi:Glyoxalase/Bleomycin resistance protein/Dioxygenase superfamily
LSDKPKNLFQAAWVVNDLEEAMRRWIATARIGPFFVVSHVRVERVKYRGAPGTLDFSSALAQAGPMQIELIEQHSDGPSAYRDAFPKGNEGFHHVAMMTQTYEADLELLRSAGNVAATEGMFGDMRFAYVDTRARLGHMTEIIDDCESIKKIFKKVADAAVDWDGTDPIRYA